MTPHDNVEMLVATEIEIPVIVTLTPAPTTEDSGVLSSSSCSMSPIQASSDESDVSPTPPARCVSSVHLPASQAQAWSPTHTPSWSLGPQYGNYVHAAAPYLIGVPGGPGWEKLLANFIAFEGLSSSRPVSIFSY
jgi:hypothetical protein